MSELEGSMESEQELTAELFKDVLLKTLVARVNELETKIASHVCQAQPIEYKGLRSFRNGRALLEEKYARKPVDQQVKSD